MMIDLSKVYPNPHRDFDLDPIDPGRVAKLAASIGRPDAPSDETLGFWGGICVRKVSPQEYQLAFGHHRLEALKQAGWTHADLNTVDYNYVQMAQAMAAENALQRQGMGACVDAVAAGVRAVGYKLLKGEFRTIVQNSDTRSEGQARKLLLEGKGLGVDILMRFFGKDFTRREVKVALKALKKSGRMARILDEIREQLAAEEAEEDILEAAKTSAEAVRQTETCLIHPAVHTLIPNPFSLDRVISILGGEEAQSMIPVEEQPRVVQELINHLHDTHEGKGSEFTADKAAATLNTYLRNHRQWLREEESEEKRVSTEMEKAWINLMDGISKIAIAMEVLQPVIERGVYPISKYDLDRYVEDHIKPAIEKLESFTEITHFDDSDSIVSFQ